MDFKDQATSLAVGRIVIDREIDAGIMTAFIGAPVFIALVRRRRLAHL